ncbi:MAG TPA: ATP-binding protein [Burkholderiales bacterium]|nr:ATP-binding protein [Burkholderiales bacterium]
MRRSLERELSRALGFAIVAAGIAATVLAFVFGFDQAQDLQDETLREIALRAAPSSAAKASDADLPKEAAADPDSRVLVLDLSAASRPAWLAADLAPGFHTLPSPAGTMRVYVRGAPGGRIAVAQSTEVRRESAVCSAAITLLPLLALLPLLVWLARRITRVELAPLRRLAASLDAQLAERPEPLPADNVPLEVGAFVDAINRLLLRVSELIGAQRRFVADAAHELRTPLTALAVQAGNLVHAHSPQDQLHRIDALTAGIERARHLTEQLLDLARLQAGSAGAQPVDVSALGRDLIAECLPLAEQRGIDIGMEEDVTLTLAADPASLRLIVKNALDNAVRYTPPGGQVTLRLAKTQGRGVVEVIDTGPGIPPAERNRIFAPFYRPAGSAGAGSGLGLAIARDAAARCAGTISIEARADPPGTVFRYTQSAQ